MTRHSIANISKRLAMALVVVATLSAQRSATPRFTRLLALDPDEGVFAYARISPDGRTLVYASEARNPTRGRNQTQIVTLVDLATQNVLFTERGIDAYWSLEGDRMIYSGEGGVSIRHDNSGET